MMQGGDTNRRKAAVWLIAGALVCLSLVGVSQMIESIKASDGKISGRVFPKLDSKLADITAIKFVSAHQTYSLSKSNTGWTLPQKANFPADPRQLETFVQALAQLKYVSKRSADPQDQQALGIGPPETGGDGISVQLLNAQNEALAHFIYSTRGKTSLVRLPPNSQVFEVDATLPAARLAQGWIETQALEITPERIGSVTVHLTGEAPYSIVRRPDDGFAPVGAAPSAAATATAIAISNLRPSDVHAENLETLSPVGVHEVSLRGGMMIRLTGYLRGPTFWVSISATAPENQPDTEAAKINALAKGRQFEIDQASFVSLFTPRANIFSPPAQP